MAGVTNRAFRRLCREFGPGLLYVNEMVTARALVEGNEKTRRMLRFDADEQPRSAQLYGTAPGTMFEAVRRLVDDHGVEHVDLNFGCPVPKVTRKGGGAALPVRRRLLASIVASAVRAAAVDGVPVTVKFRMGIDDGAAHLRRDRPHRRGRGGGRRRPPRPHGGAALRAERALGGHRRAEGGGHVGPGARQRRHLGGDRRAADDGRDRLRRRRRSAAAASAGRGCSPSWSRCSRAGWRSRPARRAAGLRGRGRRDAPPRPAARRGRGRGGRDDRLPQARRLVRAGLPGRELRCVAGSGSCRPSPTSTTPSPRSTRD